MSNNNSSRDAFRSRFGFIMSCIGSAVGMGCIWLFPYRVGQYGGFAFLVPFLIFVVGLGFCGVMGEMAFGRAMRTGPVGAFRKATQRRGSKIGGIFGLLPLIGSTGDRLHRHRRLDPALSLRRSHRRHVCNRIRRLLW